MTVKIIRLLFVKVIFLDPFPRRPLSHHTTLILDDDPNIREDPLIEVTNEMLDIMPVTAANSKTQL